MTPATAAALRCPVCQGPLLQVGRTLRCPKAHSFDLAKEGYANLLPIQKKHAADPGDGKEMVRARRAFLSAGHYTPLMQALADLCTDLPHGHIVDAGCGEGSYDAYLYKALGDEPAIVGFDLLLNIFSPFAGAEFRRMLRPGGHLVYAVPTARHLYGLKEVLYDHPYENEVRDTAYEGFTFVRSVEAAARLTLTGDAVQQLFAMTPYYWNTPADGAARLQACKSLTTEIGSGTSRRVKRIQYLLQVGPQPCIPDTGLRYPDTNCINHAVIYKISGIPAGFALVSAAVQRDNGNVSGRQCVFLAGPAIL